MGVINYVCSDEMGVATEYVTIYHAHPAGAIISDL